MTHNLLMRFIYKPRCEEDLMDGVYRVVDYDYAGSQTTVDAVVAALQKAGARK